VAIKLDTGGQVYNDHMHWRDTYHSETTRFPGLPWILPQTLPEAPWGDAKVDVMISELLGDSLETIRRRSPTVRARDTRFACMRACDGTAAGATAAVVGSAAVAACAEVSQQRQRRGGRRRSRKRPCCAHSQHSLPPRAVCCVAIQCLDMLEALHTKAQLVHRDIKPANLLVRTPHANAQHACFADALTRLRSRQLPLAATPPQQLHLIDFGIAGKISARGADVAQNPCAHTRAPARLLPASLAHALRSDGTALYSHRGAALKQPISFRDDLEALGYTLLHLAAGALPWEELALKTVAKKARPVSRWGVCVPVALRVR
jgi:hypothetical protein